MRRPRLLAAASALLLAATLTACGSDDDNDGAAAPQTSEAQAPECSEDVTTAPDAVAEYDAAPEIEAPTGPPPCELVVEDLVEGKGEPVTDVTAVYDWNYEGVAWSTGEVFDSSFERGEPADFSLDMVIPGWTEGLQGIRPGGRRILVIPPDQAYGEAGRPGIAPNETLVFVVDLVGEPS